MSQNVPDRPQQKYAASTIKHCYVRWTRKSVYSPFMQSTWLRPPSQEPDGGQNIGKKAAAGVSTEKSEKISMSIDR